MADKSDWRLHGQERYLQGITLVHRKYRNDPTNLPWRHEHCEFCWAKFMEEDFPDVLHVGYAVGEYIWVCEDCFHDFKGMFAWKVIENLQ